MSPLLSLLLALSSTADAGVFTQKTMQDPWPERQIQRPMVLPKGWTETSLGYDHKFTRWTVDSTRTWHRLQNDARWDHGRLNLTLAHGFSRQIMLWVNLPIFVHSRLQSDLGTDIRAGGFGDASAGLRVQPWHLPMWSMAFEIDLKTPSGSEWPGNYQGGAAATSTFLLGTGITNVGINARFRLHTNRWYGADLELGGRLKLPAVVGYVVEDGGFGNGWLDPGDELWMHVAANGQLGSDVSFGADFWLSARGRYRMGTSGPGAFRTNLSTIAGSSGVFTDFGAHLSWEPFDHLELQARARHPIQYADVTLFSHLGLDEFSPQPGWTFGGSVVGRW